MDISKDEFKKIIGDTLRKARKKKNISQKDAAEKIGVSHSVLTPGMKMELSISLAALFQN